MKKLIGIIIVLALCIYIFTSCDNSNPPEVSNNIRYVVIYQSRSCTICVDTKTQFVYFRIDSMTDVVFIPLYNSEGGHMTRIEFEKTDKTDIIINGWV